LARVPVRGQRCDDSIDAGANPAAEEKVMDKILKRNGVEET